MNFWPYVVLFVVLGGLLALSTRNKRRALAQEMAMASQIGFGSEVMTTSGLYGTVLSKNDDGTVQLAIAPGVEVKWALAALRDAKSLPPRYRQGLAGGDADTDTDSDSGTESGSQPES